ncbi:MAG: hypothetical protein H7066_13085 [Cytophagaceae bacterium]|nr:hypothetical protein [Gemmatimonadaceae bacterium]
MVTLTFLAHWLHVAAALVWMGVQVSVALLIFPALATRPGSDARPLLGALAARIPRLMQVSGLLVIILGLVRGTVLGPIRTWSALGSRYALLMGLSLVLMFALIGYGQRTGPTLMAAIWDGEAVRPGAHAAMRRHAVVVLATLALITGCMVAMRFGV